VATSDVQGFQRLGIVTRLDSCERRDIVEYDTREVGLDLSIGLLVLVLLTTRDRSEVMLLSADFVCLKSLIFQICLDCHTIIMNTCSCLCATAELLANTEFHMAVHRGSERGC